ncbi:MAG: sulfatase, partial [Planctomycetota bacterium]
MKHLTTLLASIAVALATNTSPAAADERPMNVLFIAVDDLKPAIGAFGDGFAVTPNLDQLSMRGVAFTNAHCQQAVCAPSRVSLLTGLRPDITKVWNLKTEMRDHLPDVVTLPQRFKLAGYQSIGMGKIFDHRSAGGFNSMDAVSWSEPFINIRSPAGEFFGFQDPDVVEQVRERKAHPDFPKRGYHERARFVFPERRPPTDRADVPDEAYHDGAMTEVAKERLDGFAQSEEPFFLAVGFYKPHLPFNAPEKYWAIYDRDAIELAAFQEAPEGAPDYVTQPGWELRSGYNTPREGPIPEEMQYDLIHGYYATVSYIDAQVGELMAHLDETGLADNTIVVLWGDHGFHLGDHAMWCKHSNFEQATRSPLIFVDPRHDPVGPNASPVEFLDIYPTLLEMTGLSPMGDMHGHSLVPIVQGEADRVKEVAVSQYPRGG